MLATLQLGVALGIYIEFEQKLEVGFLTKRNSKQHLYIKQSRHTLGRPTSTSSFSPPLRSAPPRHPTYSLAPPPTQKPDQGRVQQRSFPRPAAGEPCSCTQPSHSGTSRRRASSPPGTGRCQSRLAFRSPRCLSCGQREQCRPGGGRESRRGRRGG